jgi:GntR family transcriptional repressor for pyruvate dehydrogenase complex
MSGNELTTAGRRMEAALREQIVTGALKPGDRLPSEHELSAEHGVSRNTAREAIRALSSLGLVVTRRGVTGGTFVTVPRTEHLSGSLQTGLALLADSAHLSIPALVEAREVLEVPAAEMAARRRSEEDVAAIRAGLFDPESVPSSEVFVDNRQFHVGIIRAAHNPLMGIVAEPVFDVLSGRFSRGGAPRELWREVDRDHREILGYIEAGDQAGARESARAHLWASRRYYEAIEAAHPAPGR